MARPRGARPSPRHKLAAATPHQAVSAPEQWAIVPPKNSVFLNDTDGCCVTSEECVNLNTQAYAATNTPVIVSDAEIKAWAGSRGFLNGANLTDVMDAMQQAKNAGLVAGATEYFDGPYQSVDWTNRANLCSAIYASRGSVKISVDANVLETAVGATNGWYLGSYSGTNQDHCVGLVGYGSASFCFASCGVPLGSGVDPNSFCYLLDTWGTVGVVAATVIESHWVGEAWLRSPTSIPAPYTPPPAPPSPTPRPPTRRAAELLLKAIDMHQRDPRLVGIILDELEQRIS